MHYYQHHIGDFIKATSRLPDALAIGYLRLLWIYYESEKPLPNDLDVLSIKIGATKDDVFLILKSYFYLENDVWKNKRCDKQVEAYHRQSSGGKEGSIKRWSKGTYSPPNGVPIGEAMGEAIATNNHKPITNNHKPITNNQVNNNLVEQVRPESDVFEIFSYWQEIHCKHKAILDAKRRKTIKARLKEGYSIERIKAAINGIKLSKHHMGQNDRATIYDDIELICRNGSNVDKFADMQDSPKRFAGQDKYENLLIGEYK